MFRTFLLAGVLVALAAQSAPAATVQVLAERNRLVVVYRAGPGEANELTVSPMPASAEGVRVHDGAAPLAPGSGCAPVDPGTVDCDPGLAIALFPGSPARFAEVRAELGDRGDVAANRLERERPVARIDGGPGDDRLTGSLGAGDELTGGPGRDVLRGQGGKDLLLDGDGPRRGVADTFDGGPGRDDLSYAGRRAGVGADLARRRGEDGDRLAGIEDLVGGQGPDTLRGDGRPNALEGGPGADRLLAGGRADALDGGAGADALGCGGGRDTARRPSVFDRLARDCERALVAGRRPQPFEVLVALPLRAAADGAVEVRLSDPGEAGTFAGRVTLGYRGLLIARPSAPVRLRPRGRATARARVVAPAMQRLRSAHRLPVAVGLNDAAFTATLLPPLRPADRGGSGGTAPD
jgi:RTX calcium-binding nonapeptide repeat (4 copies)